ncbi:MAG: hypothetical protein M1338_02790, partial [Patescibacteria group bacterium]|nr:hypothetical protein [Patescibacteria group bacterium]
QNPNIENIYLLYTLTFAIIISIIACSVGRESAKWHYAENEEIHNKTVNAGWALYFGFYLSYCTLVLHHFNFINF